MTKLCEYCGVSIPKDDARFCYACGRSFAPETASASVSPGEPAPHPAVSKEETSAQDDALDEDRGDAERFAPALLPQVQGLSTSPSPKDATVFQKDVPAPPARPVRPSPRLLIAFAGLALVLLVGTVLVVSLTQQSTNSPWQSFSSANLGFSMHYPVDWQVKSNTKKSQVQFSDDNQTVVFTVTITNAGNTAAKQVVQQQASKAGLSGIQAARTISFAGVTWQVVEGTLSTEGVSYHVQFLAAKHGSHLYLITQQALKANYANNERVFFSQMRSAWQFTS